MTQSQHIEPITDPSPSPNGSIARPRLGGEWEVVNVRFIVDGTVCRVDFTDGVQKAKIYYYKGLFKRGKSPRWTIDSTPMGRNITSLPRKLKKAIKNFYPVLLIAGDENEI